MELSTDNSLSEQKKRTLNSLMRNAYPDADENPLMRNEYPLMRNEYPGADENPHEDETRTIRR